jgi:hypothetical protein
MANAGPNTVSTYYLLSNYVYMRLSCSKVTLLHFPPREEWITILHYYRQDTLVGWKAHCLWKGFGGAFRFSLVFAINIQHLTH